jgi:hypothetical protein
VTTPHHDITVHPVQRFYMCDCGGDLKYTGTYTVTANDQQLFANKCDTCLETFYLPSRSGQIVFLDELGNEVGA